MKNINNILRVCKVVETDPELCLVRVELPDADDMVSDWLQVIQQQTLKNKNYYMSDIEELVLCLFLPNGLNAGFVMGSVYSKEVDMPPYTGQDINYKEYDDKTLLKYDRKKHEQTANIKGNVIATVEGNEGGEESDEADGTVDVEVKDAITIKGKSLTLTIDEGQTIEAEEITITASGDITIESGGNLNVISTGKMTLSPTGIFELGKQAPANPAQGPLNCLSNCLFAGPPHGGNTVA